MKYTENRPWGSFTVYEDDPKFKVKILQVNTNQRLSLQRHRKRDEHWTVVQGAPTIQVGDNKRVYQVGEVVEIKRMEKHRIENHGKEEVKIIEVQTGDYFGEDDIERFEDDYHRADKKKL